MPDSATTRRRCAAIVSAVDAVEFTLTEGSVENHRLINVADEVAVAQWPTRSSFAVPNAEIGLGVNSQVTTSTARSCFNLSRRDKMRFVRAVVGHSDMRPLVKRDPDLSPPAPARRVSLPFSGTNISGLR